MRFASEVESTGYGLDFVRRLHFGCLILRSWSLCVDVILKISAANELFNFIFQLDTFLRSVTNILMVPTILILIPFGAVST